MLLNIFSGTDNTIIPQKLSHIYVFHFLDSFPRHHLLQSGGECSASQALKKCVVSHLKYLRRHEKLLIDSIWTSIFPVLQENDSRTSTHWISIMTTHPEEEKKNCQTTAA